MTDSQTLRAIPVCIGSTMLGAAIADAFAHNTPWVYLGAFIGFVFAIFILYLDFKKEKEKQQNTNQDSVQPTESIETKIETKNSIDKDLKIEILDDLRSIDTILRQKDPNELLIAKARNLNQNLIVKLESL